ncbi:MAG TPA: hypothetical protein VJW17_06565, partial [Pyrinomonadaceae bacterium]|nr:hypothetical protein [Pyrinomonadaceae bacterium]
MCYFRHRQYMGQQRLCRFITIQVCPKDLLVVPAAGSACGKPTNGAKARGTPDVWHKAARVHIA